MLYENFDCEMIEITPRHSPSTWHRLNSLVVCHRVSWDANFQTHTCPSRPHDGAHAIKIIVYRAILVLFRLLSQMAKCVTELHTLTSNLPSSSTSTLVRKMEDHFAYRAVSVASFLQWCDHLPFNLASIEVFTSLHRTRRFRLTCHIESTKGFQAVNNY